MTRLKAVWRSWRLGAHFALVLLAMALVARSAAADAMPPPVPVIFSAADSAAGQLTISGRS